MALDERTAQEKLTQEERRGMLRAFADRMLLKISAMDDPEDMPGVERAMRVAAVIERVYSRCDRAEHQIRVEAPNRFKVEAECAIHQNEAIKARVTLANTLKWGEERRLALGPWWDAAQSAAQDKTSAPQVPVSQVPASPLSAAPEHPASADNETPEVLPDTVRDTASKTSDVIYTDYTNDILAAQANLALRQRPLKPPP
jgi:hypothetical protein